jgi:hypothetical protein
MFSIGEISTDFDSEEQEIPKNHTLVGFYGNIKNSTFLCRIGLITQLMIPTTEELDVKFDEASFATVSLN